MVRAVGSSGYSHQPSFEGKKPSKELSHLSSKVAKAASNVYISTASKALNQSRVATTAPKVGEKVEKAVANHGIN